MIKWQMVHRGGIPPTGFGRSSILVWMMPIEKEAKGASRTHPHVARKMKASPHQPPGQKGCNHPKNKSK